MSTPKLVYTVAEAAEALGMHPQTVYAAVERGALPSVRVGRRIVIPQRALEEFLEQRALARTTGL